MMVYPLLACETHQMLKIQAFLDSLRQGMNQEARGCLLSHSVAGFALAKPLKSRPANPGWRQSLTPCLVAELLQCNVLPVFFF